jgi:hypothetical protein
MNSNALVIHQPVEPTSMAELKDFAKIAASSKFYGAETPEQALMLAMTGRDLGLSYSQSLRAFHVIKGKPSLSADGMVAVCLQHRDVCEYFRPVRVTDTEAVWVTKRVGADPIEYTFTMEDAKAAGLTSSDMYRKHPKRMLSARCKSFLARDVYTELLLGLYDEDEVREHTQRTPPVQVVATVVEALPEARNEDLAALLSAVTTKAELVALKGKVPEEALRARYEELKAAATARATQPVREPGEEG